ncbi:MAG: hypothetical protein K8R60_22270 [Burkholderiales bacterium]|nr:hypothetical protein [Burkholderiales bacterium]
MALTGLGERRGWRERKACAKYYRLEASSGSASRPRDGILAAMTNPRTELAEPRMPLRERLLEVPWDVPRSTWYGRLALFALMAIWGTGVVLSRMTDPPMLLHLTVILFHEAGHVIFSPLGEALRVAGGTLGQLLMPLICAVALHRRGDNFGAAIGVAWMSLSLIDASVYAWDAADPVLPLIGGGTGADSFHDFIFLFDRYGQLGRARGWALAMKTLGVLGLYGSLAWAAALLYLQKEHLADR